MPSSSSSSGNGVMALGNSTADNKQLKLNRLAHISGMPLPSSSSSSAGMNIGSFHSSKPPTSSSNNPSHSYPLAHTAHGLHGPAHGTANRALTSNLPSAAGGVKKVASVLPSSGLGLGIDREKERERERERDEPKENQKSSFGEGESGGSGSASMPSHMK